MLVELDHKDLVALVKGCDPSYENMDHPVIKRCGDFAASYGRWSWCRYTLEKLTDETLFDIYSLMKRTIK